MAIVNNDGSRMGSGLALPKNAMTGKQAENALRDLEVIDPHELIPVDLRVLLRVADVLEMTDGGIFKPESFFAKEMFSKTYATFISAGSEAFTNGSGDYIQAMPKAGDRVITTKYAGNVYRDKLNNLYRFCNDKDIVAIIKE